jgi:hypothetical protein
MEELTKMPEILQTEYPKKLVNKPASGFNEVMDFAFGLNAYKNCISGNRIPLKPKFLKRSHFNYLLLLICTCLISSCSSMYIPSTTNIPLLSGKGETQCEISASTNSLHLSGDYAFSDKFAFMANGSLSYGNFSNNYDIFTSKDHVLSFWDFHLNGEFTHRYGEIGIGRYNILQRRKRLEIFGGLGFGHANDKQDFNIIVVHDNLKYYQGFLQINYGKTLDHVDIGAGLRVASSHFDYTYQNEPSSENAVKDHGIPQNLSFTVIHIEPTGFVRFGFEKVKCIFQVGLALAEPISNLGGLNLDKGIYNGNLKATIIHISLGLNFRLKPKYQKQKVQLSN